jgi:predicted DNA-binding transcriptional regulator AlpA
MPRNAIDDGSIPERDSGRRSGPGSVAKIDKTIVERAAAISCTTEEMAALLGVERTTLWRHIEKDPEIAKAIEMGNGRGRATLRRLQWKAAEEGSPAMLIWLGKQVLGQQESISISADVNVHRILSEAPLTEAEWTELNVTQPDE